jgi:aspartyl protease family protein
MRLPVLFLLSFAGAAAQADVGLLGVTGNRALLSVDGAAPRMYGVGAPLPDGSKLVAVSRSDATIEHNGQRYTVTLGQPAARPGSAGKSEKLVLAPDSQGHYVVQGEINSVPARMLIDTGASLIALPGHEAERMGIDFRKGRRVYVSTANGQAVAWRVKVDTLRLGDMELHQLDALVHESGLPIILLGNSFLNRFDMRRDGDQMTLQRRY